jgi:hypothetical protein
VALSHWSVPAAVITAAAQAILLVVTFAVRDRWGAGRRDVLVDIGIGAVAVVFTWYCWILYAGHAAMPRRHASFSTPGGTCRSAVRSASVRRAAVA